MKNMSATADRGETIAAIFTEAQVIPVLTIERVADAVPLARALVAGGVRVLEVTLRTPVAVEAAKAIMAEVPDAIVGIGTILSSDDLARAEQLGARFGISPGATPDPGVLRVAKANLVEHMLYFNWLFATRQWIAGDAMTLADFALAAH